MLPSGIGKKKRKNVADIYLKTKKLPIFKKNIEIWGLRGKAFLLHRRRNFRREFRFVQKFKCRRKFFDRDFLK